eukprot:2558572-Prorocentrum_lima.AAC.1
MACRLSIVKTARHAGMATKWNTMNGIPRNTKPSNVNYRWHNWHTPHRGKYKPGLQQMMAFSCYGMVDRREFSTFNADGQCESYST